MSESATTGSDAKRSGRRPEGPAHARKGSLMQTLKRTVTEFSEDNLTDSAAALTYYAVLSIFPALLAMVSIVGLRRRPADRSPTRSPKIVARSARPRPSTRSRARSTA